LTALYKINELLLFPTKILSFSQIPYIKHDTIFPFGKTLQGMQTECAVCKVHKCKKKTHMFQ